MEQTGTSGYHAQSAAWSAQSTQMLWDAFLNGTSLFPLLEMSAAILSNPVIVRSTTIYQALPPGGVFACSQQSAARLLSWASTAAIGLNKVTRFDLLPQELSEYNLPYGLLCTTIAFQGKRLGQFVVCGITRPFTAEDCQLVASISGMLAILTGTDSFVIRNRGIPNAALFHALLKGEEIAPQLIREYIKTLPHTEERTMSILTIDCRTVDEAQARSLVDVCSTMITCSMRAIYQGYVVLLYHGRRRYALEEHYNFLEYLARNGWKCGLSRSFSDFFGLSRYYEQAKVAVELGPKLMPGKTLYDYEECAMLHVIQLASDRVRLEELVSPKLLELQAYDTAKGTNFIETLRVYLANVNNLNIAADLLNVHRNTLFYRLRKIEDITGWDLNSGEALNDIYFYLKIFDMMRL